MAGARYAGRAVYFSDVVVRRDSTARSFADLRGLRWAYNEPGSHSGYNIVRYHLARLGEKKAFFASAIETGAHQATLRLIAEGEVDASAVDSTVLETELRRRPRLRCDLRVIETWGPSPAPPWVVSKRLPSALRLRLRRVFLGMRRESAGRAILRKGHLSGFSVVSDRFYDPIRRMARKAAGIAL